MIDKKNILTIGSIASIACSLEVAAPKPGNVHRGADFSNLFLQDFLVSGTILGQVIDQSTTMPIGPTVLEVVQRTRQVVGTNTNLGIALLIVPLAKAAAIADGSDRKLTPEFLTEPLARLTNEDTRAIYEAIRMAMPAGLGASETGDVNQAPPDDMTLIELMKVAAGRDLIARQYTNQFEQVFVSGVSLLNEGYQTYHELSRAIVFAHVALMAEFPDSLIARKCGIDEAIQAQRIAGRVLQRLRLPATERGSAVAKDTDQDEGVWACVGELDFWLRAKGNKRNPGTTADLIAASLFVAIYNGVVSPPYR